MALSVLDGNQSATTLSSVVTGGEHIVAHSVVSLGTTAISNIATAVSGVSISISGTPSTTFGAVTGSVSILGTPTVTIPGLAHLGNSVATAGVADATTNFVKIGGHQDGQNQVAHIVHVSAGGAMKVDATDSSVTFGAVQGTVTISNFPSTQTIAGTVTVGAIVGPAGGSCLKAISPSGDAVRSLLFTKDSGSTYGELSGSGQGIFNLPVYGTITVGNSVTIGSLPAISGTVTANLASNYYDASNDWNLQRTAIHSETGAGEFSPIGFNNSLPISGTVTANVSAQDLYGSSSPTAGTFLRAVNYYEDSIGGNGEFLRVNNDLGGGMPVRTIVGQVLDVSGTVTVGNSVTIGANPSGALTTRFGSVTTANTAQITSAVTNASRKYLLAQNISAGTVTIGIGFSPTTTQGIQLTAGGGLTFDAFCPTGAVYWLGAVTGAAWTILEG